MKARRIFNLSKVTLSTKLFPEPGKVTALFSTFRSYPRENPETYVKTTKDETMESTTLKLFRKRIAGLRKLHFPEPEKVTRFGGKLKQQPPVNEKVGSRTLKLYFEKIAKRPQSHFDVFGMDGFSKYKLQYFIVYHDICKLISCFAEVKQIC